MSDIKDLPKELPPVDGIIQIDIIGNITKKRYLGEFGCKIPTIKDQCMSAKHEAILNGEYGPYLPKSVSDINKMVSYLRYTLTDVPKFWKDSDMGYALRDQNVIKDVYDKVVEFEEDWVKKIWGEEGKDGKDSTKAKE